MRLAPTRRRHGDRPERGPRKADGKLPPHDLDAERASLSAALLDAGAAEILPPADDFFDAANGRVAEAIHALVGQHEKVDAITVAAWLRDRDWLGKMGGTAYLAQLTFETPAVTHADRHCKIVSRKARRRRMIAACHRIANEGYFDVGESEQAWLDEAANDVASCAQPSDRNDASPIGKILQKTYAELVQAHQDGKRFTGIATGYDRLDDKTAGMHDGDLIIVAGRPGMGKTSFVLNIATNVATPKVAHIPATETAPAYDRPDTWIGVAVFSLEMPKEQLATRMSCSEGRIDLGRLRQGGIHAEDWRKLIDASSFLSKLPIWIDDTPAIGLLELRAKVRRVMAEWNRPATETQPARKVGLVVVDYLQLMTADADSREQEISAISRGLKALAKEFRLPVVALSQLNRSVETRGKDKRPQLSDLRESGAIEQDADTIIFIYRDDYYNPETSDLKGIAELIIAKQRNGPTGKVKVRFSASCTRFENLEPGDYPEDENE